VARAIFNEVYEGRGTEHGGVYHDFTKVPLELMQSEMAMWYELCLFAGIDPKKEPVVVAPSCHHFMGGARINEACETSIRGLYACGEAAGGIDGANRLGGNAFPDIIAFGARAGNSAAEHAVKAGKPKLNIKQVKEDRKKIYKILERKKGFSPRKAKDELAELMWNNVGVMRTEKGLKNAVKKIIRMKREYLPKLAVTSKTERFNYEWVEALEFHNMLDTAEAVARSALIRTESREAHWRKDYPKTDNKSWLKNIILQRYNGRMKLWTVPCQFVDILPPTSS